MSRKFLCVVGLSILALANFTRSNAQTGGTNVTSATTVVTVKATDASASEVGPDLGTFTVYRDGPTNSTLVVFYRIGGTASNGNDYKLLPGYAILAAGATSADIAVTPLVSNHLTTDTKETVELTLRPPFEASGGVDFRGTYAVGTPSNAVVTIAKAPRINIPPIVRLLEPSADGGTLVFTEGSSIKLMARASDADGSVTNVTFFSGTNAIGVGVRSLSIDGSEGSYSFTWTNVIVGEYSLTAHATDNSGATSVSDAIKVSVIAKVALPVVNLVATDGEASEVDNDSGTFVVTRTGSTTNQLTVYYSTGGTAENGIDYKKLPGFVTIASGNASAQIIVAPLSDNLREGTETVVLELHSSLGASIDDNIRASYVVGVSNRAVVTIADARHTNVPPVIRIIRPEVDADEHVEVFAGSNLTLLASATDSDGSISNVVFLSGTNVIGAGARVNLTDGDRSLFSFTWTNLVAGDYKVTAVATDNEGAVAVSDALEVVVLAPETLPVITVVASDANASEVGPDSGKFTVSRTGSTNDSLTVFYRMNGSATNGKDYKLLSGSVTFKAGSSTADIEVAPIPDNEKETNETAVIQLVQVPFLGDDSPIMASHYTLGTPSNAVVTIADGPHTNTPPVVSILRPENGATLKAGSDVIVVARATDRDGGITTVEFLANGATIGTISNITVSAGLVAQEVFELKWTNVVVGDYKITARATDNEGAVTTAAAVQISVKAEVPPTTNSTPVVTIFARDPIASVGGQSGTTNAASFLVHRTDGTNADLTVFYSISGTASNAVDYAELSGQVIIPAGHRNARVTVVPLDDKDTNWIETVTLTLQSSPAASPVPPYMVGHPAKASIIIIDRDAMPPHSKRLKDGLFHARLGAAVGLWTRVDASDDLTNWETVGLSLSNEDEASFVDSESAGKVHRFYRLVPLNSTPDDVED